MKRMEERFRAAFPAVTHYRQTTTTMDKNREIVAARVITRAVRRYREKKRREAPSLSLADARSETDSGSMNHGFKEHDMNTAMYKGLKESRKADLVLSGNRLSDSLPNMYKTTRLQPLKGKAKAPVARTPSLDKTVFTRVATVRQVTPRSAPLKKIKVMEQPRIEHIKKI